MIPARTEQPRWWLPDAVTNRVNLIRPWTMARTGALVDLALQVRAALVYDVPGDFVECGVWRGGASFLMADCLRQAGVRDRKVWLFDSFQGLPDPHEIDGRAARQHAEDPDSPWYFDNCAAALEDVRLAAHELGLEDYVEIVEGWFEDTLPASRARIGDIAILRIDCDWHASITCSLDNLYDNVSPNGFVVFDDYFTFDGAAIAVHEFLGKRRLAHRLENVISSEDGYEDYRCALFRNGSTTWNEMRNWLERIDRTVAEIEEQLPSGTSAILVDDGQFLSAGGTTAELRPFLERDGEFWGPPPDSGTAIEELERMRRDGARYAVFAWPAFWWLEYYADLTRHLRANYAVQAGTDNVLVYDLR